MKPARIFLFIIAFLTVLVVAAFFALRIWGEKFSEIVFVPTTEFEVQQPLDTNAYASPDMWFARPPGKATDIARWQPPYAKGSDAQPEESAPANGTPEVGAPPAYAVFFVHPTSYFDKASWNASLDDPATNQRTELFVRGMASPFNQASEIWVPRYRQAAIGSFLVDKPEATAALDAAYSDVEQAFLYFAEHVAPDQPIVLAGHSQGSLHLLRLLSSRIAGTPLQSRIAMVYAIGWPISRDHDLPKLGLPACQTRDDTGCVVSWLSFGDQPETGQMLRRYKASPGLDGQPRGNSPVLCTNPINGQLDGAAEAKDNRGTLLPNATLSSGELLPGLVPARCDANGILLIGPAPAMGVGVLPGNNYHVYDIPLFWRNLQLDVAHRVAQWNEKR